MDLLIVAALAAWLAAAGLDLDPPSVVVVTALAVVAWSLFAACFWPFTPCPVIGCDRGKLRRPGKRNTYRRCGWCRGTGERVRWARRVYDATRPKRKGRR